MNRTGIGYILSFMDIPGQFPRFLVLDAAGLRMETGTGCGSLHRRVAIDAVLLSACISPVIYSRPRRLTAPGRVTTIVPMGHGSEGTGAAARRSSAAAGAFRIRTYPVAS